VGLAQTPPVTNSAVNPLAFKIDFNSSTQFGSASSVDRLTQGGYSSGSLTGLSAGADGVIVGRYSNGQTRNLGQLVLATFANSNGLQPLGNNQWALSSVSGPELIGAPGAGSRGVLQSSSIEESNVDLTAELVNMITQQRNYQANAQTIKTQDQIMQTLVNLR
jgi:flagellar hook protein FlgE